jgi:hypothetical protein
MHRLVGIAVEDDGAHGIFRRCRRARGAPEHPYAVVAAHRHEGAWHVLRRFVRESGMDPDRAE